MITFIKKLASDEFLHCSQADCEDEAEVKMMRAKDGEYSVPYLIRYFCETHARKYTEQGVSVLLQ